jgi:hypothetical protein
MKSFKTLLAAAAVATFAMIGAPQAQAAPQSQTWTGFTASSITDVDISPISGDQTSISGQLSATVAPYFYATGSLGYAIDVSGWGVGADTQTTTLDIYHNLPFHATYSGFDNPTDGTNVLTTTLKQDATDNDGGAVALGTVPDSPIADYNNHAPNYNTALTKGHLTLTQTYTMNIGPEDVAGSYTSSPTITFTY